MVCQRALSGSPTHVHGLAHSVALSTSHPLSASDGLPPRYGLRWSCGSRVPEWPSPPRGSRRSRCSVFGRTNNAAPIRLADAAGARRARRFHGRRDQLSCTVAMEPIRSVVRKGWHLRGTEICRESQQF